MMMTIMISVDRDDNRVDDHNNNNDKGNTSFCSFAFFFPFFFSFLISTIIVISLSPTYIVKCVHINTGGTESAAALLCKELLSFCLTPVCFSL